MRKRSIAVYLNTLPGDSRAGKKKIQIMQAFAKPLAEDPNVELTLVNACPAEIQRRVYQTGERFKLYDTEFSFSFGYHFSKNPTTLRSWLRKDLTKKHEHDRRIWYTDANPLSCYEKKIGKNLNNSDRVRIVYGNIYPDKAEYFNKNSPGDRWKKISKEYNMELKDYRDVTAVDKASHKKGFIYICGNRGSSGYSAFGQNAADWMIKKATEVMKYTDRPIVLRQHPASRIPTYTRDKQVLDAFAAKHSKRIKVQSPTGWYPDQIDNIKACHCVVVFTSTAGSPAIVEGRPVFVEHPSSYLYAMSAGDIKNIEKPNLNLDRKQWLYDYAYAHWSIDELARGEYWSRVRSKILNS